MTMLSDKLLTKFSKDSVIKKLNSRRVNAWKERHY
jgi:hypothetical protein